MHDFAGTVVAWYHANRRDLPWRRDGFTAWGTLVSEVMLQQTPVARVIPRLEEWLERWPTPAALAASPSGDAVRAWHRLRHPPPAPEPHPAGGPVTQPPRRGGAPGRGGPARLPAPGAEPARGGRRDHRAPRRSRALGRARTARPARHRRLHRAGRRRVRIRAAAPRGRYERAPCAYEVRRRAGGAGPAVDA